MSNKKRSVTAENATEKSTIAKSTTAESVTAESVTGKSATTKSAITKNTENYIHNLIAVTGSPFSGKTTFSLKLALELSQNKRDIIVLSSDNFTPQMDIIFSKKQESDKLSDLLIDKNYTEEKIFRCLEQFDKKGRVGVLGFRRDENIYNSRSGDSEKIRTFITALSEVCDYIILDSSSFFFADKIASVCIENAKYLFSIYRNCLKSYENYYANYPNIKKKFSGLISKKILISDYKDKGAFGKDAHIIPYVSNLEKQFAKGTLDEKIKGKNSTSFNKELKKIGDLIIKK